MLISGSYMWSFESENEKEFDQFFCLVVAYFHLCQSIESKNRNLRSALVSFDHFLLKHQGCSIVALALAASCPANYHPAARI